MSPMKRTLLLFGLLPSLIWANSYVFCVDGVLAAVDQCGGSESTRSSEPIACKGCADEAEALSENCKPDKPPGADFQDLQSWWDSVLWLSGLRHSPWDEADYRADEGGVVHITRRPAGEQESMDDSQQWPGGMARLRVRGGEEGTTDYGSAVCVGYGRTPGEWTFLSCSHNFESGGEPELQLAGQWVPATLLYRDKLAEAVETAPGQYTRVESGPDRSVLVVHWQGRLRYRPVSLERYVGDVALSGYPSTPHPVTIAGQTEEHASAMKAALQRPSQGGFSGGGVFNMHQELVGIWTSGAQGSGYGHYVFEFLPIFRQLGWAPGNWQLTQTKLAQHE
jgi:hypothetical protein